MLDFLRFVLDIIILLISIPIVFIGAILLFSLYILYVMKELIKEILHI